MKKCSYCAEQIQEEAVKCRYCGSYLRDGSMAREWYRKREGAMLGGVCAGLAELFGVSPTALRLGVVVLTLLGFGWGIAIYLVLWMIMPYRDGHGRIWGKAGRRPRRRHDGRRTHDESRRDRDDESREESGERRKRTEVRAEIHRCSSP